MTVERIFWLIVGILLLLFAFMSLLGDGLNIDQKTMDAIQNFVLGILALGLAVQGLWVSRNHRAL